MLVCCALYQGELALDSDKAGVILGNLREFGDSIPRVLGFGGGWCQFMDPVLGSRPKACRICRWEMGGGGKPLFHHTHPKAQTTVDVGGISELCRPPW